MEQSNSCETDLPEIRRRLESIQRQRALIDDLATRLKAAQLEHDRMERELNEYRFSIAPIRKCPDDVLLMIFKSFADDAPELVADLLQVCKWWHDIAVNAPRLWTHIKIKVQPTWDQRKAQWKNTTMIEKYLKNSASLPLYIDVDLRGILSGDSQLAGFRGGLTSIRCNSQICSEVRRFMCKMEGDEIEDPGPCFSESYGPEEVSSMLEELVGSNGNHMRRWKSVRIFLPDDDDRDITEIWKLFSGHTPQLTELLINTKFSQLSWASRKKPFPNLSSLETLTLQGVVKDIDFLGLTFPSVKHLDLEMDTSRSSQLSLFTSLEYLNVFFQGVAAAGAVPTIHLPVLQELTIHIYGRTGVEWRVPVLQTLTIVSSLDDESRPLPNVQALEVCWEDRLPANPTGSEPELHHTLQAILSKYRDMQKLWIHIQLEPI